MEAIVDRLAPLARNRRRGQLVVWLLGLIIFFDDYANSLLLGNTMRPLTDRLRISREKLAYLVDSTAAPVSGLAIVSTWVAGEIGFIQAGFANVDPNLDVDGFGVFLATIPYRFYVLLALLLVPLVAITGRDFGEMLRAERNAVADPKRPLRGPAEAVADSPPEGHWLDAVLPVLIVVAVTVGLILATGRAALAAEGVTGGASLLTTFGNGDSYLALVYGSLAGWLSAVALALVRRRVTWQRLEAASFEGAAQVLPALAILWLAWALSGLTGADFLATGDYLAVLLRAALDVRWMPTAVFLLAAMVAFATGTSWGTMGILMPLVVPVTWRMLADAAGDPAPGDPLLTAVVGSVLAGAIFGDHCSPISDTTVLSSQASGCDHIAHVRTQLPYALLAACVAMACGTVPAGFGVSPWWLLPLSLVIMLGSLFSIGRPVEVAVEK
jgi:Na+/H+ antiporter NhaC